MPVLTNEYLSFHPEVPSVFYHYCSVDTFLSIINNNNIWLSDAEKTNDYTEMKWLFSKIHETVEQALLSYRKFFSEEVILKSKKLTYQIAENLLNKKAPIVTNSKSFLSCFSESGDLLSQWRAYGNDGNGIAIGFNPSIFEKFTDESYYIMSKVIYSDKDILEFMHSAIDEPLKWAIESSISSKTKELDEMELAVNISLLVYSLWQEGPIYKHNSFIEEQEWRLFRSLQSGNFDYCDGVDDYGYAHFLEGFFNSNEKYLGEFTRGSLKFRSVNNDIRLYFELGFEKCKKEIIKEIIIGPKCKIEAFDLKLLLAKNKYIDDIYSDSIIIKNSNCPYI